ncbi:DUF4012 domain-containing protein [Bifidobacterium sp. ESL0745]|uniref:DUF4012 domain-containing protein n=1 Tax=Bifidobacterium sp. ESL0745 TaxID=2983226 RepID=UPI0023F98B8D|nr:DUF4012 domain-containing protein [Bifidobacterium sp. ESL0745]MDF7665590.1 DUF4012 domain-containing protein [Bifidobacterium sp. ESL0745]
MREPRGRHLAATRPMRRHHVWRWVLLVIFVLLLAIVCIGGYFGKTMYDQAKEVKTHEQNAVTMLSGFSGTNDLNSLDQVSQQLPAIQSETQQAKEISHGKLWNMAAKAPYIGNDIKTFQGMTSSVDGIVRDSVPQFLNVVTQLKSAKLSDGNGQINLQPIIQAQNGMKTANVAMQTQVGNFHQLPAQRAKLSVIRTTYKSSDDKLSNLAKKVDDLAKTFQILPDFLGANQTHNYAVMSMTTSEARSAGGLIGSVGLMTTSNGKISIGQFRPNADYLPYGSARVTSSESAMFHSWGPLPMSFDIRDLAVFPDTSRTAEAMQSIWSRTSWGKKQPIDGVVTMDPVFLQALIKLNGNVKLANGQVLTGDNTAEFLLNTIYKTYSPAQQDLVFGEVATQSVNSMFSGLNLNKMAQLGGLLGEMAKGRHFSIYSFDQNLEQNYMTSGYTAQTPNSEENPQVGVYVTEQNSSKMDWYVKRTSKITRTSTNSTGARTYHVNYTMTNTVTNQELSAVPRYISGENYYIVPSGSGTEKTLIYAPAGGSISNVSVSGKSESPKKMTLDGKNVYAAIATVMPGASVTFSFDVTTSPKTVNDLSVDQTPMGWEDPGVTRANY